MMNNQINNAAAAAAAAGGNGSFTQNMQFVSSVDPPYPGVQHDRHRCCQVETRHALAHGNGDPAIGTLQQHLARARAGGSEGNKGREAALAGLEMVTLLRRLED